MAGRPVRSMLVFAVALASAAVFPADRPDIPVVVITIDTLRADRLGCYGYARAETPNLDALAREGVLFRTAFTTVPLTVPAHTSIFTGLYPAGHGVRDNDGALSERPETLAALLRRSGYATAAFVGSAVLERRAGLARGFDHYGDRFGATNSGAHAETLERPATEVVQEALDWLSRHPESRQFLWLHLFDPHDPYAPPQPFLDRHAGRPYDGEIAAVDAALGKLFDYLRKTGQYDRALIVVAGDHGEGLGEHGEPNHGLFLYEATIRVPLLLKLPGAQRRGDVVESPVSLIDVLPTILDRLGLPGMPGIEGQALLSAQPNAASRGIYSESLYLQFHFGWSEQRSLRTARYKYIESTRPELYDLERDPGETRDLAAGNHTLAESLQKRLRDSPGYRFATPAPAARAQDRERLERLASLGYVSGGRAPRKAQSMAPDPKDRRPALAAVLDGITLFKSQRYQEAEVRFASALRTDPGIVVAHDFLGSCFYQRGRYDEAVRAFREEVRLDPRSVPGRFNLARSLMGLRRLAEAIAILDRLVRENPQDAGVWKTLARACLDGNQPAKAASALERAHAIQPEDAETSYLLGRLASVQGRAEEAGAYLAKALELEPQRVEALLALGAMALQGGNLKTSARPLPARHRDRAGQRGGALPAGRRLDAGGTDRSGA